MRGGGASRLGVRRQAIDEFALPDHAEPLACNAFLYLGIVLDRIRIRPERIDGASDGGYRIGLVAGLALQLEVVAGAVLPALQREEQAGGDERQSEPPRAGHSE